MRPYEKENTMKDIRSSVKEFVKDHKPEITVFVISVAATAVILNVNHALKDYVKVTDLMHDEMSTGGLTEFIHKGTEYVMGLKTFTID
jgi:hypothetical protein